jgi:predicted amidophosphoribosyltransferase
MDEAGRRAAEVTIDLDAQTNACPACGGVIPRGKPRCPDCGLRFA